MFNRKAFSLVEIVVVAIVMATLTAIAIPNYINYTQQAAESAAQNNLISVYNAQKTFYLNNGYYCTTSSQKPACGTSLGNINDGLSLNVTDTYFSYTCTDPNTGSDGNNGSTFNCTATYEPNNATPIIVILTNNPIVLPGGAGILNPSSTAVSCTPITSCPLSDHCGTISNNCGGSISCGSCTSGQICSANQCVASSSVTGACSTGTDHPTLTTYPSSYCSTGSIYGNPTTNPATSSSGATITWTCAGAGGGSSSGTCSVCVPNSCPTTGYACGPYTNSCGGTISSCGTCPSGQACSGNTCIACTSSCSSTTAEATCAGVTFADTCGNANICSGTETCTCNASTIPSGSTNCNVAPTTNNQTYSPVSNCGTVACSYTCGCNSTTAAATCTGTNFADNCGNANVCPGTKICSCSGTLPPGATNCNIAPTASSYTYNKTSSCVSTPCSYTCSCPNQSTTCPSIIYADSCGNASVCTGTQTCSCGGSLPTGSTNCNIPPTSTSQSYNLVSSCGSTPCSYTYTCPTGQHFNGISSCVADTNGECATPSSTASAPTNLCTTGPSTTPVYVPSTNASGGTWTWQCQGTGPTGTTANCYDCDTTTCPTSYNCGDYSNSCNTLISSCSPGCTAGTGTCGGGGTANVCGCSTSIPEATACAGKSCGSAPNGCGGTWTCGTCSGHQSCGGGGVANACGCTSTISCASDGYNCGTTTDNCGNTLNCGTCPQSYQTCTNNTCVCTPLTSCPAGDNCGTITTCGGQIICGPSNGTCSQGSCVNNVCNLAGQCASPDNGSTNTNPTTLCLSGTPSATVWQTTATSTSGGYENWSCYGWGTSASENCSSCMGNCPTTYSCGPYSNTCGTSVNCGTCTLPQTCGGGTNPHACGCTSTTCTPTYACGSTAGTDNCGNSCNYASPTCPANTYCSSTTCQPYVYNNWCERDSNGQNATLLGGSYAPPGCYDGTVFYTVGQSTSYAYGSDTITCEVSSSYVTNQANCADLPTMTITSATWGADCGVSTGNETAAVASDCNGQNSCTFTVGPTSWGDPAFGCEKDFSVTYSCSGGGSSQTSYYSAQLLWGTNETISC